MSSKEPFTNIYEEEYSSSQGEAKQPKDEVVFSKESQPNSKRKNELENASRLLEYEGRIIFRSVGATEKDIKISLFMLEGEYGFKKLSEKEKMWCVVKRSDRKILEWYYDQMVEKKSPTKFTKFREELISFCTRQPEKIMNKYKEEKWHEFIRRVELECKDKKMCEEQTLEVLKKATLPNEVKFMMMTNQLDLDSLKEVMKEIDKSINVKTKDQKFSKPKEAEQKKKCFYCGSLEHLANNCTKTVEKKKPVCYKCGSLEHLANKCTGKPSKVAMAMGNNIKGVQEEKVKVNDYEFYSVIDTASSINVVSSDFVKKLKLQSRKLINPKSIKLIDSREIKLSEYVEVEVELNEKKLKDKYYVVEKSICEILIGKELYEKFMKKSLEFPVECRIETKGNSIVSWGREIRNFKDRTDFQILVEEYEKRGIIEEKSSLWLNPVRLVRKENGNLRFCIDLRKVNDLVELDGFNLPLIQSIIRQLYDMKYFSVVDLKDGYFQVPLNEKDREKTSFMDTKGRMLRFTKLPQGFKNAPALFQRGMTLILKDLLYKKCFVYIDDILIFGRDQKEHDEHYKEVTDRLKLYNLEINEKKSQLKLNEVRFLGYKIAHNKLKPLFSRTQGIVEYEKPNTQRELRRFIGILNYDRTFVKDLSSEVKSLYDLLSQNGKKNSVEYRS